MNLDEAKLYKLHANSYDYRSRDNRKYALTIMVNHLREDHQMPLGDIARKFETTEKEIIALLSDSSED
jgi:hypothetical protein